MRENKKLFKFIKKLKEDKFIFTHRWGDLPLWGGILSVLFSKNEYVEENMISYFHKSHEAIVNPRISVLFVKKYLKHFIKKVIPLKILIYAKKYTNYG